MKITVELELPFLDEDGYINDDMQQQVLNSCIAKINNGMVELLKSKIDTAFNDSLNAMVEGILNDYMSKPVVISNGYKTESYDSALSMVEKKFSSLYDAEFQKTSGCGTDPIYKKLNDKIALEVRGVIQKLDTVIASEAKKIAENEVKSSALYVALEKLGHINK